MQYGKVGGVVRALVVDEDGKCWLRSSFVSTDPANLSLGCLLRIANVLVEGANLSCGLRSLERLLLVRIQPSEAYWDAQM